MQMPEPDPAVIARRAEIVAGLRAIVPGEGVIDDEDERRAYEMRRPLGLSPDAAGVGAARDGRAGRRHPALLPGRRGQGRAARRRHLAVGRRHAAGRRASCWASASSTACSRSTTPTAAPCVQPGVTNLGITKAVEHEGFYYAPDPSSQIACSIGGNVAENSGGVHCLKYGLTTNNLWASRWC